MQKNKTNRYVLEVTVLLVILLLNFISFPIAGGESQYLSFAKQFVQPNWIADSFSLTEFPGTRIFFQYIFGWPLKFIEIETAAKLYRILNFLLIAFPLASIFRRLLLPFIPTLFFFQLFLSGQSLLGKEWMIISFEPKTISYVFLLWAFYFWHKKKAFTTALFALASCYFHVIVGGWFLIALAIISFWNGSWKKYIKPAIVFFLLFLPFLIYLLPLFTTKIDSEGALSPDHIYVYYRLPHHMGIAKSWEYFINHHLSGSLFTLLFFLLAVFAYRKKWKKEVLQWIIVGFGISLVYIGVAFIDSFLLDKSGSLGLKFYPFRLNTFAYFLSIITLSFALSELNIYKKFKKTINYSFILFCTVFALIKFQEGINETNEIYANKAYFEMCETAKNIGQANSIFLLSTDQLNDWAYINFSIFSGRENYVVYKFVPAEKNKIVQWHERYKNLKKFRRGSKNPAAFFKEEKLDFLITENAFSHVQFAEVFSNDSYFIYQFKGD